MGSDWNGEQIDYTALIAETGAGLDLESQRPAVAEAAKIFNERCP